MQIEKLKHIVTRLGNCRGNDPTAHQVRRMKVQSVVEFQDEL